MTNSDMLRFTQAPYFTIIIFLLVTSSSAFALETPMTLASCAIISDKQLRLQCYDQLATIQKGNTTKTGEEKTPQPQLFPDAAVSVQNGQAKPVIGLVQHWDLDAKNKHGTFNLLPHEPNYVLLANYSASPNGAPYNQAGNRALGSQGLNHAEVAFQLGFKMKLLEDKLPNNTDVWFGYTQQSYWQAYNRRASSPFRETDYQPELMAVMPLNFDVFGMHARFLNFGLAHQSNGQGTVLSRSWNRIYLQTGLENDHLTLTGRVWKRLNENAANDDNPDIVDYMGYGDVTGTYKINGHELSVLARHNFRTNRGATQIGWAFPLSTHLKGYVQAFSGYGQSLIDYNYSQKTIGMGFLISY